MMSLTIPVLNKPVVFVMVGLPCSGKTTVRGKMYERNFDLMVLSTDDLIEEAASILECSYSDIFSVAISHAQKSIINSAKILIPQNRPICWDQTNLSVAKRNTILQYFNNTPYKKVAVVLRTPTLEEFRERNKNRPGKVIPETVWLDMAKNFVKPTLEEGFDEIIEI